MIDYPTLKIVWWLLVGVLLVGFAIMDGHDMGVGTWSLSNCACGAQITSRPASAAFRHSSMSAPPSADRPSHCSNSALRTIRQSADTAAQLRTTPDHSDALLSRVDTPSQGDCTWSAAAAGGDWRAARESGAADRVCGADHRVAG